MTIDELKAEALRLNPEERAELASELLVSLDELSEPEVERMWLEEAMRRDAALDSGAARGVPANEVFSAARARLR
jgi:Putative addiction module component